MQVVDPVIHCMDPTISLVFCYHIIVSGWLGSSSSKVYISLSSKFGGPLSTNSVERSFRINN